MNAFVMVIMILAALLLGAIGLNSLTQATIGVGLICLGAVAGILARIAQSGAQHADVLRQLKRLSMTPEEVERARAAEAVQNPEG